MRFWKAILGLAAACAVCCAGPVVASVATLAAVSSAIAALGTAWQAWARPLDPAVIALLVLTALGGVGVWWYIRTQRHSMSRPPCPDATTVHSLPKSKSCSLHARDPREITQSSAARNCACPPGACGSPTITG